MTVVSTGTAWVGRTSPVTLSIPSTVSWWLLYGLTGLLKVTFTTRVLRRPSNGFWAIVSKKLPMSRSAATSPPFERFPGSVKCWGSAGSRLRRSTSCVNRISTA